MKTFGNTLKNSVEMFRLNKNPIKKIACGLQENVLKSRHTLKTRSIKHLSELRIKKIKYVKPWASKRSFLANISSNQMKGTDLRSLIEMISKSKPYLPLLFAAGGFSKLTEANLCDSRRDLFYGRESKIEDAFRKADQKKQIREIDKENKEYNKQIAEEKKAAGNNEPQKVVKRDRRGFAKTAPGVSIDESLVEKALAEVKAAYGNENDSNPANSMYPDMLTNPKDGIQFKPPKNKNCIKKHFAPFKFREKLEKWGSKLKSRGGKSGSRSDSK